MLKMNELFFEGRFRLFLLGAFILIGLLAAVDIIADLIEGTELLHAIVEIVVFVIAIVSALAIVLRLLSQNPTPRERPIRAPCAD